MESFDELWEIVQEQLKSSITEVAYNVWIAPLKFVKFTNDTVYLSTETDFKRKILNDKFVDTIKNTLEGVIGFQVKIEFVLPSELIKNENSGKTEYQNEYDYTFDNFITGPSNKFPHAAAINVAENPGEVYNPFFIYGHSGLGKTHLLLAIYNEIKLKYPDKKIIYTSGEHFTNELIYYIGKHNTHDFHDKYRSCDVLLVDDIHFISKGDFVQEEFFHTFNALKNNGSQIVLTSDRPPREMLLFEERLRTRFEMGLTADIQPPTIETRVAIVKRKCDDINFQISDEVALYIAENIKKNIRQLEGAVKKLKAYHDVEGIKPNITSAKKAISDIISDNQPGPISVADIIDEVARTMDVSADDIRSEKRSANISLARQVAIYVTHKTTNLSLKAIGTEFGNKHHSSIIYSLKEIEVKFGKDLKLKATADEIIKNLNDN